MIVGLGVGSGPFESRNATIDLSWAVRSLSDPSLRLANFGYFDKFSLSAWVRPSDQQGGTVLSRMTDEVEGDGYSVVLRNVDQAGHDLPPEAVPARGRGSPRAGSCWPGGGVTAQVMSQRSSPNDRV